MVGCGGWPPSIDNLNIDNPDAPLRITVFQIDEFAGLFGSPYIEACSRDDSVWFVTGDFSRDFVEYRAGTGVQLASVPLKGSAWPSCALTSNSLWVRAGADILSGFQLIQIDIATNRIIKEVALEGQGPLTTEQDTLWIMMGRSGKLFRMTENETHPVFLSTLREVYRSIVFAAGSIWAVGDDECRVDRIDPNSGKVLAKISLTPHVERLGLSRLFGNDLIPHEGTLAYGEGSVWLSCNRQDPPPYGAILRIDPNRNEVIANIPVDFKPRSPVFAMGFAWVSTYGSRRKGGHHWLEKIDVRTNKVVDKYRLGGGRGQPLLVPVPDALWAIGNGVAWHIKVK